MCTSGFPSWSCQELFSIFFNKRFFSFGAYFLVNIFHKNLEKGFIIEKNIVPKGKKALIASFLGYAFYLSHFGIKSDVGLQQ